MYIRSIWVIIHGAIGAFQAAESQSFILNHNYQQVIAEFSSTGSPTGQICESSIADKQTNTGKVISLNKAPHKTQDKFQGTSSYILSSNIRQLHVLTESMNYTCKTCSVFVTKKRY